MAAKKILFVEGEPNTPNGDLRIGFSKLLGKKLTNLPKIVLGGGKKTTIDIFLNNKYNAKSYLLVDLDEKENYRIEDLKNNSLTEHHESVFFMIQEMESWFLSQPDILNKYYGKTVTGKEMSDVLTKKNATEISEPKDEMKKITRNLNKGEKYHQISHAVELLERLDADKLEQDFPDFKRLIETLKK